MSGVHAFQFQLNNLNNGKLNGVKAMPSKDSTSDSDGSFAADRKAYASELATIQNTNMQQYNQKKWVGGSRDASDVAHRRRIAAVGSSLNPTGGSFAFTSKTEKNTRIEALNRCRSSGNCVPPKVRASTNRTNVPTPIWKSPNLVRTKFHAILTKGNPTEIKNE